MFRKCELSGESLSAGQAWGAPVLRLLPVHSLSFQRGPDVSPPLSVPAAMLESYPSGTISQRNFHLYIALVMVSSHRNRQVTDIPTDPHVHKTT